MRKSADKSPSQPWCSHSNTIYEMPLQKTIVLRITSQTCTDLRTWQHHAAKRDVMAAWMLHGLCFGEEAGARKLAFFRVKWLQAAMKGTSCVRRLWLRSFLSRMASFHCDLQPQIQKNEKNYTHTQEQPLVAEHRGGTNSRQKRPQPQLPHTRGTVHRRLQPLYTEKCKLSWSGFLPKTKPIEHSCSHYNAFCSITWLTRISLRTRQHQMTTIMQPYHCDLQPRRIQETNRTTHTQEQPLVAEHRGGTHSRQKRPQPQLPHTRGTVHRRLQPLYTEKYKLSWSGFLPKTKPIEHSCRHYNAFLCRHFPSSPLPLVTTSLPHHFPPSPLPKVTTSLPHHFPSSPLPRVTTTSLPHHFPKSPLRFLTTSLRHHFTESPPLPFLTNFALTTSLHSLFFCDVLLHRTTLYCLLFFCDVLLHRTTLYCLILLWCIVTTSPPFINVKSHNSICL